MIKAQVEAPDGRVVVSGGFTPDDWTMGKIASGTASSEKAGSADVTMFVGADGTAVSNKLLIPQIVGIKNGSAAATLGMVVWKLRFDKGNFDTPPAFRDDR